MNDNSPLPALVFMFGMMGIIVGAVLFSLYLDAPNQEYCKDNGYDRAKSDRYLVDGHYRIHCWKQIVVNNTLIDVDDWIRWDKGLVSSEGKEK